MPISASVRLYACVCVQVCVPECLHVYIRAGSVRTRRTHLVIEEDASTDHGTANDVLQRDGLGEQQVGHDERAALP